MRFLKFHGYGNDYLVFEGASLTEAGPPNEFVRRVCDRHYGAGADGVALVDQTDDPAADFAVRIFNADGSEAAMSGNGTRAAAASLYYQGSWSGEELRLKTRAGIKLYRLRASDRPGTYLFEAEIGRPEFASSAIPMLTDEPREPVLNYPLEALPGTTLEVTALLMCNPNCCIFVANFAALDWRQVGAAIESHRQFPEKTNVEFIRVRDPGRIEVRVWERGVGETLSSGTGACAAAVAASVNGRTGRRVQVEMPGGRLEVEWRADGEVLLTGTAELIYRGDWLAKK